MLTNTITLACFRLDLQRKKIETEQKYKADIEAMQKHVEQVGIAIIQYHNYYCECLYRLRLLINLIQPSRSCEGELPWRLYFMFVTFRHFFFPLNCHNWSKFALFILQLHISTQNCSNLHLFTVNNMVMSRFQKDQYALMWYFAWLTLVKFLDNSS